MLNVYSTPKARAWRLFYPNYIALLLRILNLFLTECYGKDTAFLKSHFHLSPMWRCVSMHLSTVPSEAKGVRSPGAGVPGRAVVSCHYGCPEPKSGPFEKQYLSLTSESSLQSHNLFLFLFLFSFLFFWSVRFLFLRGEKKVFFSKMRNIHHLGPQTLILKALKETCNATYKTTHHLSLRERRATPKLWLTC